MKREKPKKWPKRIPTWRQIWDSACRGMPKWTIKYGGKPRARRYIAKGGPFNNKTLMLVDGDTAPLRVGAHRGRYLCGLVADRHDFAPGTTVWKPLT